MRVAVDSELVPFRSGSFDLAVSALALHWVSDLPGALIQLRRALKPDGLLLAAMLGGDTLAELRAVLIDAELVEEGGASPRVSPTATLADAAALLQRAGFVMPVADADKIIVAYANMFTLLHDLRGMGETNALSARRRTPLRRSTLARAAALYTERYGLSDGRIPATFEILFLTGWAPDLEPTAASAPGRSAASPSRSARSSCRPAIGPRRRDQKVVEPGQQSKHFEKPRNQGLIGRRHPIFHQIGRPHPGKPLALTRHRSPRPCSAEVERHQKMKVGIRMRREGEWGEAVRQDPDTELLCEFAD
jgi:hypothetical protein